MPQPLPPIDLCAIGNVCIDIVADVSDAFLAQFGLTKSVNNQLLAAPREILRAALPDALLVPGGVGANVCHVISALGGQAAFLGKAGDDDYAGLVIDDMKAHGIFTHLPPAMGLQTSQVFCLNTPDGDRTFASYDVAATTLKKDDIDIEVIKRSTITYLDSHTMIAPGAPDTFFKAIAASQEAGCFTCLNPCDVTVIAAHPDIMKKIADNVSMLICNLHEAQSLFGTMAHKDMAEIMAARYIAGAVTDGANGAYVFSHQTVTFIPPADVSSLDKVDSNGAGDHFAAGFLFGFLRDLPLEQAGKLGQLCAMDCLSHPGARPLGSLKHLVSALTKI